MSTYRGVRSRRTAPAQEEIDSIAFPLLWRQYASASSGNTLAGIAPKRYYREATAYGIWMFNRQIGEEQVQAAGGQIAAGKQTLSLPIRPSLNDEFIIEGRLYRVDAEPVQSVINDRWIVMVSRGDI